MTGSRGFSDELHRMSDQNSKQSEQVVSAKRGGSFRWLIDPERRRLLLPASGLWILMLDWLLFSSNAITAGLGTPIIIVLGFVLGSAGTYFLQRRFAGDIPWKALLKAVFSGIVVGVPWPLAGTLIGGWVLFFSGLGNVKKK